MSAEDPFLNWLAWLEDLEQVLGEYNVQLLPMEDMCKTHFWARLANFLNIHNTSFEELASPYMPRMNVRCENLSEKWKIRNFKVKKSLTQSGLLSDHFSGSKILTKSIRKTEGFLIRPILRLTLDHARERSIQMENHIRDKIKKNMASSNLKLSEKIERDLTTLGY